MESKAASCEAFANKDQGALVYTPWGSYKPCGVNSPRKEGSFTAILTANIVSGKWARV